MGLALAAQLEEVEAEVQRAQSAVVKRGTRALAVAWAVAALLDALLDVALTWVREKVEPEFDSLSLPAFRQTVFSHSKP
jgi:predicted metallopeptidase